MKKFISLLLAVLMIFSVATVAFAEVGAPAEDVVTTETDESTDINIDDVPIWVVKVGPKFAKVILKIVAVIVKIGMALGLIDSDAIIDQIAGAISGATTTQPAETTTVAVAA